MPPRRARPRRPPTHTPTDLPGARPDQGGVRSDMGGARPRARNHYAQRLAMAQGRTSQCAPPPRPSGPGPADGPRAPAAAGQNSTLVVAKPPALPPGKARCHDRSARRSSDEGARVTSRWSLRSEHIAPRMRLRLAVRAPLTNRHPYRKAGTLIVCDSVCPPGLIRIGGSIPPSNRRGIMPGGYSVSVAVNLNSGTVSSSLN